MARKFIAYVNAWTDHTDTARFYFRAGGKRTPLPGAYMSSEFMEAYNRLLDAHKAKKSPQAPVVHGPNTLGWVIEKWVVSSAFKHLAGGSQERYRRVLDPIKETLGRGLICDLKERHVRTMRAKFKSTSTADLSVIVLSNLWTFAKETLALDLGPNPTTDIQRLHQKSHEHEPWPEKLIAAFEAEATPRANMRMALLLLLYTGQRIGDVADMKWSQFDGEGINVRQEKTDALLWIPCHTRLLAALAAHPRKSAHILTTFMGRRYNTGALSNAIRDNVKALGYQGFSAHGLRKNAGIALAEAGATDKQIMSVLGHATFTQAHAYMRRAQQKVLAKEAMKKLEAAGKVTNSGTKRASNGG
ncbi:MAG: tyrosine-type recombinase/integrase [Rhizobiales bacterium]|nr:tyrosine-type recombinase/integrase [Hyphomicrobiales bacterium]